ncbi:hypothetical protein J7L48_04090, partial [bacterium]|nr:hypothetical protein [bacterium]
MKKKVLLPVLMVLLYLFNLHIFSIGDTGFGGTPRIVDFKILKAHIGKNNGNIIISYDINEKIHIYIRSDIANELSYSFANKSIEIDRVEYVDMHNDEKDSYIQGKGTIALSISGQLPLKDKLKIKYQGCSEEGLCFLPNSIALEYNVKNYEKVRKPHKKKRFDKFLLDLIKNNIKNPLFAMLLVFIAGFLTSLTPCVYPMIPITISYFGRRSQGQKIKNSFLESILYVLGLSITYTLLGIIAAITG